ncbi:MAG: cupin domain-containing protein [Candidatus Omnitrophica bacterium]|jgi:mannose-6-phosphate isomerase-like protein (cupin superfamily)|nr:cupin domain-containing protein [Candidatus Omnitrophota bacterium]
MKLSAIKLVGKKNFLRLLGKDLPGINLRSGLVVLRPGESVGEHTTGNKEEAVVILEGKARFFYGRGKSFVACEKSFIYVSPETLHDVKNIGRSILRYVYITSVLK